MAIAVRKPTAEPTIKPNIPKIESVENNSVIVDTKVTPLSSLITYVEGMTYVVNYYVQILSSDSATYGHDVTQLPQYQQYRKIERLEIKITTPISVQQEEETKLMTASGSGVIHSSLIPNIGDMFVADVGDGREGVFQINRSEKKSIFKDSVYEVDFELVFFSEDRPTAREDLEIKVVQVLHYVRDFMFFGENPLISTNEFNALRDLKIEQKKLIDHYFQWFFSNEFSTFTVPGQAIPTYDPFIVRTLTQILTTNDHPWMLKMRELNVAGDDYILQPQIWTALIERDIDLLAVANDKMKLTSSNNFSVGPMFEGIRYSGINHVVYPVRAANRPQDYLQNTNSTRKPVFDFTMQNVTSMEGDTANLVVNTNLDANNPNPDIYNVLVDDYYVLSEHFYKKTNPKSKLEVYVENYIQHENNDPVKILALAKNARRWGGLERFYYIPLLLILIKAVLKEI